LQNLPVMQPDVGVILVASGYLFRCPECEAASYRTSALESRVTCDSCRAEFPVVEVRHRTSEVDIAPGVTPGALYIPQEEQAAPGDDRPESKSSHVNNRKKKRAAP
jgi:hypothetical protein